MLSALAGGSYEAQVSDGGRAAIDVIWADWCSVGRAFVIEAGDLSRMAARLASDTVLEWPCPSRSHRARLLPLVLASVGRIPEAAAWLPRLRADIEGRDQLSPPFSAFEAWFRRAYPDTSTA
jgi:hypothetical protein